MDKVTSGSAGAVATLDRPEASGHPAGKKTWQVGTLTYTRGGLANVFFWLLWGDFCLALMDNGVASQVVSLQLKKLGASNAAIGFLNGTLMSLMTAFLVTIVSTTSDRTRTRLGRRMPYLLWASPPLALCLIGIGYSQQLAKGLQGIWPGGAEAMAWTAGKFLPGVGALPGSVALVIGMMAVMITLYKFFDLFPQSIYYYLWADVVPAKLMGSFVCLFRVVAAVGLFIFERWVLGMTDTHPERIYIGAGLLYLVSFVAMSLIVKEGKYPPPPERPLRRAKGGLAWVAGVWAGTAAYVRECFTHSYYIKMYAMNACFVVAIKSMSQFLPFFGTQGLGLTTERYGEVVSWKNIAALIPALLLGPIVDRFHPVRIGIVAGALVLGAAAGGFLGIHGERSFSVLIIAVFAATSIYQAGTGALLPRLLPREQYGQFASANAVVFHLGWAAGSLVCGAFLDWVTGLDSATGKTSHPENYRYLFLWITGLAAAGVGLSVWVYWDWKRLGGDEDYVPPMVAVEPVVAVTETVR
jgi:Na+/melibiose symporter-like transporter